MDEVQTDSAETRRLLEQACSGDSLVFEQLFVRHEPYLLQIVGLRLDSRLRARVDPADIVQEAYVEAFRRLDAFLEKKPMPFRLWLRQLAIDQTLKARPRHIGAARRTLQREAVLPEESSVAFAEKLLARTASPSHSLNRRELRQRLQAALAKLSEPDREVLLMRHFEGLSNQEVAFLTGIDAATASKRHGRAMLRLHGVLFEDGMTESQL